MDRGWKRPAGRAPGDFRSRLPGGLGQRPAETFQIICNARSYRTDRVVASNFRARSQSLHPLLHAHHVGPIRSRRPKVALHLNVGARFSTFLRAHPLIRFEKPSAAPPTLPYPHWSSLMVKTHTSGVQDGCIARSRCPETMWLSSE